MDYPPQIFKPSTYTAAQIQFVNARQMLADSSIESISSFEIKIPESTKLKVELLEEADILVYGNELTSVAAAVTAAKKLGESAKVILLRPNEDKEPFGGLVQQGGLSYLDRSKLNCTSSFFDELLDRANVQQVSLDPINADKALKEMISEANIKVISNAKNLKPKLIGEQIDFLEIDNLKIKAHSYIDASQNADLARAVGLPYSAGFECLGLPDSTLAVSPVFIIEGFTIEQLQQIEKSIFADTELMDKIRVKIRQDNDLKTSGMLLNSLDREMVVGIDYIDIQSSALGVVYAMHTKQPFNVDKASSFLDRGNIAILNDGRLSVNALLYRISPIELMKIVNNGSKIKPEMIEELKNKLEPWLNSFEGIDGAVIVPPKELYIRRSLNIKATEFIDPLSGLEMIEGGTPTEESIGSFSYNLDDRGGIPGFEESHLPLVTFNFGIEHTLLKNIKNLAIVDKAAGYSDIGVTAGRILDLNIAVASGVGMAAAIAKEEKEYLNEISSREVKAALEELNGREIPLLGKNISDRLDPELLKNLEKFRE